MRATGFIVALLVVPSAALLHKNKKAPEAAKEEVVLKTQGDESEAAPAKNMTNVPLKANRPKSASPEGIELLWQREKEGVPLKGVLLYLHGCHGKATGMWKSEGADGFHFNVCDTTKKGRCMGYTEEVLMRQKARARGYAVVAVSGGVGNPRGCMNTHDVPRIQLAMKHLIEKEEPELANAPVIMLGHSSGGRVLPELVTTGASIKNAQCIVPVADEIRVKGDSSAPLGPTPGYPEDVSAFFVYMERDEARLANIGSNIGQMRSKGVRTGELKIQYGPVTPELFSAEGNGLSNDTAKKVFRLLQKNRLINGEKILQRNPYSVGGNWQDAMKTEIRIHPSFKEEIGGIANLQQYMDIGWSEHWMAGGRYLDQILNFCVQKGNERKHEVGKDVNYDLMAKVHETDKIKEKDGIEAEARAAANKKANWQKNKAAKMQQKKNEQKQQKGFGEKKMYGR